jgi:hypothetical protein
MIRPSRASRKLIETLTIREHEREAGGAGEPRKSEFLTT